MSSKITQNSSKNWIDPLAARLLQEIITELEAALDRGGDTER